jgi:glycosyltransferase involved in cell wall biosynthesis
MNPLVSVCIPTYNGEQFITEALLSAITQTYRPLEIVVSDDNSKDNTLNIVRSFIEKTDINIRIYKHTPAGIAENWNNCIKQAKGDFIKFLFQDDLLDPNCIEEMINPFFGNEKLGLTFCRRHIIYNENDKEHLNWLKQYGELHIHWGNLQVIQKGKTLLHDPNLLKYARNKVGEPVALLLRKKVFEKIGYFNNELKQDLDIEFCYRVFSKFDVGFIDKKLVSFRLHSKQASVINKENAVSDCFIFHKSIYKNCFWHLHSSVRKELFFRYNKFWQLLLRIKKKM